MGHRGRWLSLCTLVPAVVGCGTHAEKAADAPQAPRAVPVTVADLQHRPVERTVEVVGTLKGFEEVTVGAKKGGRVARVRHDIGDRIRPGEPIVELDPVDADLAVLQAESRYLAELTRLGVTRDEAEAFLARHGMSEKLLRGEEPDRLIRQVPAVLQTIVAVEKAQQNLNRQRQINARNAGTIQDLQNSENDFKAAEAARDNALVAARTAIANALASKVALDVARQGRVDLTVRAPELSTLPPGRAEAPEFAVARRAVAPGQWLRDGDPVADLVIVDPLRLWANVPERFAADVATGQAVRVAVAGQPGRSFAGAVARINPSVDAASRTFQVEVAVPNPEGRLRPGGFAKVAIVTRRDAIAAVVPTETVVRFAGVTKLFLAGADNKAHAVDVETGLEGRGWVEVVGPLPAEGRVVTTGQSQLAEGTPITIKPAEPARAKPQADTLTAGSAAETH